MTAFQRCQPALKGLQRGIDKIAASMDAVRTANVAAADARNKGRDKDHEQDQEPLNQLADAVASLVQQMREEQKVVRQWAQSQQVQQNEIQRLLLRQAGQAASRGRLQASDEE